MGHPKFKESILEANDTGTVITGRQIGPTRCVKNKFAEEIVEKEKSGISPQDLLKFIGPGRSRLATTQGEVQEGTIYCGQIAGLISELKNAAEVIEEIIKGAEALVKELGGIMAT
jgi:enoyl-[acyl-carrier protein] reductase II